MVTSVTMVRKREILPPRLVMFSFLNLCIKYLRSNASELSTRHAQRITGTPALHSVFGPRSVSAWTAQSRSFAKRASFSGARRLDQSFLKTQSFPVALRICGRVPVSTGASCVFSLQTLKRNSAPNHLKTTVFVTNLLLLSHEGDQSRFPFF